MSEAALSREELGGACLCRCCCFDGIEARSINARRDCTCKQTYCGDHDIGVDKICQALRDRGEHSLAGHLQRALAVALIELDTHYRMETRG